MIRIAYIGSEQTTNHTFSKIEVRKLVYEQENVFSSEDALVFLSNHQTEINECDGILISSGSHIDFGVYLTLHIRLNQDWNLDTKPVVLLSDDEIESFNRRRLEGKSAFISTDDTKFMSTNEWHPQDMIEEHFTEYNYLSSSLEINMNQFYAVPLNNRHQITNEWGAYKLAYTARLFNLLPIIEEKQPASKTIYFKYLKRKMLENSSNTELSIICLLISFNILYISVLSF